MKHYLSFGQYVAITGDGAELGNWTPANSIPLLEDANQENYHSASVYLLKGKTYEFKPLVLNRGDKSVVEWGDDPNIVISLPQTSLVELLLWFILGINFHGKDC